MRGPVGLELDSQAVIGVFNAWGVMIMVSAIRFESNAHMYYTP